MNVWLGKYLQSTAVIKLVCVRADPAAVMQHPHAHKLTEQAPPANDKPEEVDHAVSRLSCLWTGVCLPCLWSLDGGAPILSLDRGAPILSLDTT